MTEFFATLRDMLAHLAGHDPQLRRFGARHHGYRLGPPLDPARLDAIEAELGVRLPDEYRDHLLHAGDGGAGPYHGLMPLDHPIQLGGARGRGRIGLAHLGCGYFAELVLGGDQHGQIWLDARGSGDGVFQIHGDFRGFYLHWIETLTHQEWPAGYVTPGRCALPSALTAYLHQVEADAGVPAGQLDAAATAAAIAAIPDGGIAVASDGDTPYFAAGDPVDLCPVCERTVENLLPSGMRRSQIVPGILPIPMRG